jgi:epoxyqueuosine reductase QueG
MPGSTDPRTPEALGLDPVLPAAGFNVAGALSPEGYDALVPAAWRSRDLLPSVAGVVVLACGGRDLFRAFRASAEAAGAGPDPLDAFTRRVVARAAERLRRAGWETRAHFAFETREGDHADFVALARASGLGAPSRLGLLLHPVYGPWLSIRAILATEAPLDPTPPLAGFAPCEGCPAPCAAACHGGALDTGRFDAASCAVTRLADARCALRCDARRACVVGGEYAYEPDAEAHHMRASGLGGSPRRPPQGLP